MQTTSSGPAVEAGTQANGSAVTVDVVVQATPQPEETPSSDGADLVPVALVAELTQQLHNLQATHALLVEEHHAVVQQREAARALQDTAESSASQLAAQVSSLQAEVQRLTVNLEAARSATEGTNTEAGTALEQHTHEVVALRHELQAVHQEKDDLRVRLEGEIRSLSAQQARMDVEHATEVHALRAQVALAAVPVPTVVTLTEAGAGEGDQLRDLGHQLVEATVQLHQQQRLCELLQLRIQTQDAHCAELERTKTDLQHQLQDALRRLQEHQQYLQEQRDILQQQQQRQTVLLTSATQTHVVVRSTGTNDPSFDLAPPAAAAAAATATGPAPAPPSAADNQSAAQAPHAPLQMVLPREFLALTESLQFQMEAVKNISAVVVENMRGK
jgi:chromosome segregation ATPase